MPPSLSELTQIIFNKELIYLASKASINTIEAFEISQSYEFKLK